jgi:hypothetical protein
MRTLSAPVLLSSIVLGTWLTGAAAQNVNPPAPPGLASILGETGSALTPQPGPTLQPSLAAPGLVAGFRLAELYTDNLTLAAQGRPKRSNWITEIEPFIRAARNSPRFSGTVDYRLTGYVYPSHTSNDQLAQRLDATGTVTLVPQHLFFSGTARYGRTIVNNQLSGGSGTFFLNHNSANVARGTLSPEWVQDFGKFGTMTVRYTYGRVIYNDRGIPDASRGGLNGVPDITSNGEQFSLVSPKYETWGWNIDYSQERLSSNFGRSTQFAIGTLGGSWQLNPTTRLLADVGKENKFLPDGTVDHLGARFWDVGFELADRLGHFKLLVGHRFYGRSAQFSWTRTAALLTTRISYIERPTDLNQRLLGQSPGAIITPRIGFIGVPSLTERRVYLMKRGTAEVSYEMPHSTLGVRLYDESRRFFTLDNRREKLANADAYWSFQLGPLTKLTPTVGWQRYKFYTGQVRYLRYAQLELVHRLNAKNFGSVRLRHYTSDVYAGIPGAHGYRVNVFFVRWTHLF